jgi:hypothetical protein
MQAASRKTSKEWLILTGRIQNYQSTFPSLIDAIVLATTRRYLRGTNISISKIF